MLRIARQPADAPATDEPMGDVLAAVHAAVAELTHALRGVADLVRRPAPPDDAAEVWADDDYLYIEASLSDDLEMFLDVSTCGRMVLVRVAKGADARTSPAEKGDR